MQAEVSDLGDPGAAVPARPRLSGPIAVAAVLIALGVLYTGRAIRFSRLPAVFSPDSGQRLLMVESFLAGHGFYFPPNPHPDVDPERRLDPQGYYLVRLPRGTTPYYPPFFLLVSALGLAAFGAAGLHILPVAAALGAVAACTAAARRISLRFWWLVAPVCGLATPVVFYAVVFWDHSLQMCVGAVAVYLSVLSLKPGRGRAALGAGAVLGFGLFVHETLLLLFGALVLGALAGGAPVRRAARGLVLGFLPLLAAWVALNLLIFGVPLGAHARAITDPGAAALARDLLPGALAERAMRELFGPLSSPFTWLLAALCAALALLPLSGKVQIAAPLLLTLGAGAAALGPLGWGRGLFAATPLFLAAAVAPLRPRPDEGEGSGGVAMSWLARSCVFFGLGVLLVPEPLLGWGSRYMLTGLPLFALLSATVLERGARQAGCRMARVAWVGGLATLVIVSASAQDSAVQDLKLDLRNGERMAQLVATVPPPVVLTDLIWLGAEVAPAHVTKPIFLARSAGERELFLGALETLHARSFAFVGTRVGLAVVERQARRRPRPFRPSGFREIAPWGAVFFEPAAGRADQGSPNFRK